MTIETSFDVPFVANLALKEKQVQQAYRPIIAVHKWFARRPGTLFRALVISEFGEAPLRDMFYSANEFVGRTVGDPFMGGGTPLIEANRVGCDVVGYDVNPMSAWIVREEIEHLDHNNYMAESELLLRDLRRLVGNLYLTDCPLYGDQNVPVKYFLWVKILECEKCSHDIDLFPGYMIAEDARHPRNVIVCSQCGELNEIAKLDKLGDCKACKSKLIVSGPAKRGRCLCSNCGHENRYPKPKAGPFRHRLFAIEYFNENQRATHKGRFFKKPDRKDLDRVQQAQEKFTKMRPKFIPNQKIPPGDESSRLHRWGYQKYREMFNERQLLSLELSCRHISKIKDNRSRHALSTNLSDLLRYQNLLCRYDTWALKSLDIFSVHGFPVGLIQCESNFLGIKNKLGTNVGSGGWTNIIDKYSKAKMYCDAPFEVRREKSKNVRIPIKGEWIGERLNGGRRRNIAIHCGDAANLNMKSNIFDAVFTDPPYFGNVQYSELMDFCYVWLRQLIGNEADGFSFPTTSADTELTGNTTKSRDLAYFAEGLGKAYKNVASSLKPGAPLAFTYHHNKIEAYVAVGVAILDSGLVCSATLPCPAEMSGSIHIHGTGSSIVDTVFVCRETGFVPKSWIYKSKAELITGLLKDLSEINAGGRKPTLGDARCILYGHLTRLSVWNLRNKWHSNAPIDKKLALVAKNMHHYGEPSEILDSIDLKNLPQILTGPLFSNTSQDENRHEAFTFCNRLHNYKPRLGSSHR